MGARARPVEPATSRRCSRMKMSATNTTLRAMNRNTITARIPRWLVVPGWRRRRVMMAVQYALDRVKSEPIEMPITAPSGAGRASPKMAAMAQIPTPGETTYMASRSPR